MKPEGGSRTWELELDPFSIAGLEFNPPHHRFACAGTNVVLTPTEFRLILFLATHPGRVFTRGQLLTRIAPRSGESGARPRTVDAHVRSLRKKLGALRTLVETVRGLGYRFAPTPPSAEPVRAATREFQESPSRLFDPSKLNVIYADLDLVIRYVSPGALDTLGRLRSQLPLDPAQMLGRPIDIFHRVPERQRRILADPRNLPHFAQVQLGPETLALFVSAVRNEQGTYVGPVVVWDVTTRQQNGAELVRVPLRDRLQAFANQIPELEAAYGLEVRLTHDAPSECATWTRPWFMEQVAQHLVANAAAANATCVHVHWLECQGVLEITFADDGAGMSKRELDGLATCTASGASLVRELVSEAGSSVRWESRKGVGTWVTIAREIAPPDRPVLPKTES